MPNKAKPSSEPEKSSSGKVYSYADVRKHAHETDAWMAIHGKVYDVTKFSKNHPGGAVIHCGYGRDATVLFETHHNTCDMDKIKGVMGKYEIGTIENYKPMCRFDSPFAKKMIARVKESMKGRPLRDSWYAYSACILFFLLFGTGVFMAFYSGHYGWAFYLGFVMALGHLAGHAGNHWAVSKHDVWNRFMSMTCTSLWGLREKNWEFSHLISHHCYNYTDRDYIMEQHAPFAYFRVRECDPWKPIHAYQHYIYLTTFFTAFVIGSLRLDCFPFILVSPFLTFLRNNRESPLPAPQFFASGSNAKEAELPRDHDGVGPDKFVIFDLDADDIISLVISNIVWLPLFLHNWQQHGLLHAVLFNGFAFGFQAAIVTKSLLTQHICEDVKLDSDYKPEDCWYTKQVEASTTIGKSPWMLWMQHAISFQTEHHMFPCMNAELLVAAQPAVQQTAKEFGIQYNYIPNDMEAMKQVYNQFKKLSVKPVAK